MQFLDFTGEYEIIKNNLFKFKFKENVETTDSPLLVLPPMYDKTFTKIFIYNNMGLEIIKDFLNSLLFPKSQSIIELKYHKSGISSNSDFNEIEDNSITEGLCIAKVKYIEKDKKSIKEEEILICFLLFSDYLFYKPPNNFLKYNKDEREETKYKEEWAIILYVDRTKNTIKEKNDKSFMAKKYKLYEDYFNDDNNFVPIFEIYLNDLYSNLDKTISICENEEIQDTGKEWIKLFAMELWAKNFKNPYYCFPSNMQFRGKYIKNTIETLSDIDDNLALRINVEKDHQEKMFEDLKKDLEQAYINGMNEGINDRLNDELNEANLILLDKYFEEFINGEKLEPIILLKKISSTLLKEKYGASQNFQNFYELLASKNWIESNM